MKILKWGLSFIEKKFKLVHLFILAEWSSWSEWSECSPKMSMTRKRNCIQNASIVQNYKCEGVSFQTTPCVYENSKKKLLTATQKPVLWSSWSTCSSKCGHGLVSRYRKCLENEVNCLNFIVEQRTCETFLDCNNQSIFEYLA